MLRAPKGATQAAPKLLARIEALRLLSKVEDAGLLSLGARRALRLRLSPSHAASPAERSGLSLSSIESLGLLSKAESLGALSLATDRSSPGKLSVLGLVLLLSAAAVVVAVPDTDNTLLAAQAAGAAVLGAGGLAALVGGSFLGNLQKS